MDASRKAWNKRQKTLRSLLEDPSTTPQAVGLFLQQHAEVHAGKMSSHGSVSFEDQLLAGLGEPELRSVPDRMEQSIGWILWHLARIEDVTMGILVAGSEQVFQTGQWKMRIGAPLRHTGNLMRQREILEFSREIDLQALQAYRIEVGRSTERIVQGLQVADLGERVRPARLQRLLEEGAVQPEAGDLLEYWGKRTVAGLLLMPPTRHCFIHLNQAARIKTRLLGSGG